MSVAVNSLAPDGSIRVAIYAVDLARRLVLSRLVAELGHAVVADQDVADVILAEGGEPMDRLRCPIVIIGDGDGDHDASGALSPRANTIQIDAALRAVAAGLIVRSPDRGASGFGSIADSDARALLTPRELEVLAAVADGDSNKGIARRLGISLHTVKFHVESVFRKLGARTRTEAVAKANERRRCETIKL
jgi:DNA-binding CsgD family transcriptional regulator